MNINISLFFFQVAPLVRSIPTLESLNLSFNPLKEIRAEDVRSVEWANGGSNCQIKRLILNGTEIDWHVVIALLQLLTGYNIHNITGLLVCLSNQAT